MGSLAFELRLLGVAAALGGLLLMMVAEEPTLASVGGGLAGLVFFAATRLVPYRKPVKAPRAIAGARAETMPESEAGPPGAPLPADLHAALQRKVRVTRPPNQTLASSVLPPSRVARSPSTP